MASEMKVVIVVKDGRGSVGIQAPECDPVFQVVEGDLAAVIGQLPDLVRQAEQQWQTSPRYPKTTIVTPPPVPVRTAKATLAKKPEPAQPNMF